MASSKLFLTTITFSLIMLATSAPVPVQKPEEKQQLPEAPTEEIEDVQDIETSQTPATSSRNRQNKALSFYDDYPSQFYPQNDQYNDDLSYSNNDDIDDVDDLSRSIPSRKRYQSNSLPFANSPIYYIRLPATPYMFVPGLGYVSNPPSLSPVGAASSIANPFINLPLNFLSNGKPTNIYQWAGLPQSQFQPPNQFQSQSPINNPYQQQINQGYLPQSPINSNYNMNNQYIPQNSIASQYGGQKPAYGHKKPAQQHTDSKIHHLKGPFPFNGRPTDILVLRDSYNSLYSDALTNFYP